MESAMSYMTLVATALMRTSMDAAVSTWDPSPQMPSAPMRSRSTKVCVPKKSTAAEKSSTKMSGDAMLRTEPELSPVVDWSKATVTNPRSASVWA